MKDMATFMQNYVYMQRIFEISNIKIKHFHLLVSRISIDRDKGGGCESSGRT